MHFTSCPFHLFEARYFFSLVNTNLHKLATMLTVQHSLSLLFVGLDNLHSVGQSLLTRVRIRVTGAFIALAEIETSSFTKR